MRDEAIRGFYELTKLCQHLNRRRVAVNNLPLFQGSPPACPIQERCADPSPMVWVINAKAFAREKP
jgi:hypothetical protein